VSELAYRFSRALVDGESRLRGKAHGAQHPQRVFAVTGARVTDDAHGFPLQVPQAAVVVENGLARGIVIQRVDGEVSPDGIVFARAVDVVAHNATMLIDDMVAFVRSAATMLIDDMIAFVKPVATVLFGLGRGARAEGRDLHGLLAEHHVHELETASR